MDGLPILALVLVPAVGFLPAADLMTFLRWWPRLRPSVMRDRHSVVSPYGRLSYVMRGRGPRALVLIHGFLESAEQWRPVTDLLPEGLRVIAVDLNSFGFSVPAKGVSLSKQSLSEALHWLLNSLEVSDAVVAGHSMGAEVAGMLAVNHPETVGDLILLAPGGLRSRGFPVIPTPLVTLLFKNILVQRRFSRLDWSQASPEQRERFAVQYVINRRIPGRFLHRFQRDDDTGSLEVILPRIRQKTLVVWGDRDRVIPPEDGQKVVRLLPGASAVVIPGAGHDLPAAHTGDVVRLIQRVIDEREDIR